MKFRDLSIRWKVLLITLAGPVLAASLLAWQRVDDIRSSSEKALIDKSKTIVLMAEATRNQMSKIVDSGITRPFDTLDPSKIIEAVPIVMAMHPSMLKNQATPSACRKSVRATR